MNFVNSMPPIPGIWTSVMRQEHSSSVLDLMNSSADSKPRASYPIERTRRTSDEHSDRSSSTIPTNVTATTREILFLFRFMGARPARLLPVAYAEHWLDHVGHPHEIRECSSLHLRHRSAAMDFDRDYADTQVTSC